MTTTSKSPTLPAKYTSTILNSLLSEVKPVDFLAKAYPRVTYLRNKLAKENPTSPQFNTIQKDISKLKVINKQYLVIAVEYIIDLALSNNWPICHNNGFIYIYNGQYWEPIDKDQFQSFLGDAAVKMNMDYFDASFYRFKDDMFLQFLSSSHFSIPVQDDSKVLINVNNGTLHIKNDGTIELLPFNHLDFLKYKLDFDYDPTATCPLFNNYLNRVLPESGAQNILAEFLGLTFIKSTTKLKFEKALILYGSGANGKSVFYEVCSAIYGDVNISSYSLAELTDSNGYHRAQIHNKLVNYSSEISSRMGTTCFKQLVSGEKVSVRLLYKDPFEITQYARLIFNCNELPRDVEMNNAFYRRFLIIPFNVIIPENEQDRELHSKIINSDLPGIFNWIICGLQRLLLQKNFSHSALSENALKEYRIESNSIELFLTENNYSKSSNYTTLKELYELYRSYCNNNGMAFVKAIRFKKYLTTAGYTIQRRSHGEIIFIESIIDESPFELIQASDSAVAQTHNNTF